MDGKRGFQKYVLGLFLRVVGGVEKEMVMMA